jgi:LysR family transcriptional regulator, regulator of abg operon
MRLTTLNALVAAVEEGSMRAAARRIGVSQPALTKMIRELEVELSATLLQRSTTGVFATAQGRVLYERARAAVRELDDAVEQIGQLGGRMAGELSIGAVPLAVLLLIPESLRTFSRAFPDIHLRVREELYIAQLTNLRTSEVDIAVGPIPEGLPPGEFQIEPLMPITMAVVSGPRSRWKRCRSLAQLSDAKWVYTSLSGATGYAKVLFEHHGLAPPPAAAVVNSTLGLMSLIVNGDYLGLMPMQIAMHPAAAPFLQVIPIEEGHLDLTIGTIVKSNTLLKPAVRHFIAHLHRAAHQIGGSAG